MGDDPLKSAYELAMEKIRAKEGEAGETASLTEAQKERIQEVRKEFKAKLAEAELAFRGEIDQARAHHDLARVERLEEELQRERQRLADQEEEQVQKIREEG